jgi:hypothetical protein
MRVLLFLVAIAVVAVPVAVAQSPTIDISTSTAPVDVLTIQDVDFVNALSPKWLFSIDLRIRGGVPATVNASMAMTLDVQMATGESFNRVLYYATRPFAIPGTKTFSNLDLASSTIKAEYIVDDVAKKRLEQMALPTGFMPAGIYTFTITVTLERGGTTFTARFRFVLTNPSRLDLVMPMPNDRTVNEFPLFQWTFDGPRSRLSVYERLPNQSSLEEAVNGVPHIVTELRTTSFLYPSAGVRPLEPGKTYVWFVEGLYGNTSGPSNTVKSQLRSFTVSAGGSNQVMENLLADLEKALGPAHKPVFDKIRSSLLTPTGQMQVDGKAITVSDLVKLINHFRSNPGRVLSTDLE